jgi:tRNA A37 threonylcarbamoyladenosine modification protein TsaB
VYLLAIDSGAFGSVVSIKLNSGQIFTEKDYADRTSEGTLEYLLKACLKSADIDVKQKPEAILFVSGPGSYTALRISLAFAQGLSAGWACTISAASRPELAYIFLTHLVDFEDLKQAYFAYPLGRGKFSITQVINYQIISFNVLDTLKHGEITTQKYAPFFLFTEDSKLKLIKSIKDKLFSEIDFNVTQELFKQYFYPISNFKKYQPDDAGQITPYYGLEYAPLTLEQQKMHIRT